MSELSTREKISKAIDGMVEVGSVMTISGVAREVGVSHVTIHNRYPDLAEKIRKEADRATQRDANDELKKKRGKITEYKKRIAGLRKEIEELEISLAKSRSLNASLQLENLSLRSLLEQYEKGKLKRL